MKLLDFIIIGAQKSATTSLYRLLQKHPHIHMPLDKEAPFFSQECLFDRGWESFTNGYFSGASEEKLWGTATPQYMGDYRSADRIYSAMPDTKLIAILRNPIDRAFSHFTMSVRRNMEHRSFSNMVDDLLRENALAHGRKSLPPDHSSGYDNGSGDIHHYLVWGEYGRILDEYLKTFRRDQLLVLFMEDFKREPEISIDKIMEFLALDRDFKPQNLGKVYHQGGSSQWVSAEWRNALRSNTLFRTSWNCFPERSRQIIRYWYDQANIHKGKDTVGPDDSSRSKLIDHYKPDIDKLVKLTGEEVPWKEFME